MKNLYFGILTASAFFFVLLFPQESFRAAGSGLLLWYETLVPTLLPVMILSHLLLSSNLAFLLAKCIARPLTALLAISPSGAYALLVGFFCGCPMGAKVLSDLRRNEQISQVEASYLAAFINNISPAFLTNFLVVRHLESPKLILPTLVILFGAPLLYGLFSNHRYRTRREKAAQTLRASAQSAENMQADHPDAPKEPPRAGQRSGQIFSGTKNKASATAITFAMVDASITDSICSITKLGAYIILFAVFTAMIDALPISSPYFAAVLSGITEISGGIHRIAALPLPFSWKYLLLIAVSAFGGLCCTAQSAQMLSCIGLPLKSYLAAKISVTVIAVIMALCFIF